MCDGGCTNNGKNWAENVYTVVSFVVAEEEEDDDRLYRNLF